MSTILISAPSPTQMSTYAGDDYSVNTETSSRSPGKFKYYNNPPTKKIEVLPNGKTIQSTIDALDRIERKRWKPRDKFLEDKSRRLRSLYNEDVVTHEYLRKRVARTPHQGSKMYFEANKNIVPNDRGYFPDGSRVSFLEGSYDGSGGGGSGSSSKLYELSKNSASTMPRNHKDTKSTRPFYSPGKGLGPLGSLSSLARYGPRNSREGFSKHQDSTLEYSDELHDSIDVVDSEMRGSTAVRWPDLGESYMAEHSNIPKEAFAAASGIFDPYCAPVNEYGRISPCDWKFGGGNHTNFGSNKKERDMTTVIPRGTARGIERKAIRDSRLHELALKKRRKQAKQHAKWLQSSVSSDGGGRKPKNGGGLSRGKSVDSFKTQYLESVDSLRSLTAGSITSSTNDSSIIPSYGEQATKSLNLLPNPVNPFRSSMQLPSDAKKTITKMAGIFSRIESTKDVGGEQILPPGAERRRNKMSEAIAKATKSTLLDTTKKVEEVAALAARLLKSPNSLPGHEIVIHIYKGLVETAQENPNPIFVSRVQFVKTMFSVLDEIEPDQFHRLYSTFDPCGRDKVSYAEFCCVLMCVHRPSMNQLTSSRYWYARDYLDTLPVIAKMWIIYANGRKGVMRKDIRSMLRCCSLSEKHNMTIDSLCDQLDESIKHKSKLGDEYMLYTEEALIGKDGLLIRNSCLLDEFRLQLLNFQKLVNHERELIGEKEYVKKKVSSD